MKHPRNWNWDAIWDKVHTAWIVLCYFLIMAAIVNKEWAEAAFWLLWLVYDRMTERN